MAEIFGWMAFSIGLIAFQFRHGRSIIFTQIPSNVFYVLHLAMMGATAGTITSACLVFRNSVALMIPEKYLKYLVIGMMPIVLCLVLMFSESHYGLLAAFGNIVAGISLVYRENSLRLRGLQLISQIFFISYGVVSGSWPLALMGCMSITSNAIGALRHEDIFAPLRMRAFMSYSAFYQRVYR